LVLLINHPMPKGFSITRALVITAVLVLVAIAYSALATTWVVWVPTQTSAGTTATFGNYWGGASFMYSTQSVTWITPPMGTFGTATFGQVQNYLGSSGAALWVEFSSYTTSSSYMYQGTVTATATVAIGSHASFSSSYQGFAAFAVIYTSSEKCGQLYFHADIYATNAATFYGVYMFGNATWFYVTFYSGSAASSTWYTPAVSGPNTCLSPGYYLYVAVIYSSVVEGEVSTAQVSIGTTSEGTSTVPGTQYALNIAPARRQYHGVSLDDLGKPLRRADVHTRARRTCLARSMPSISRQPVATQWCSPGQPLQAPTSSWSSHSPW